MCVDLGKRGHLVRWEDYLSKASLANVGNVFGIDKETVFAECLFAEDSQDPKRFRSEAIGQKLAARVIRFEARLETRLLFKK